MPFVLLSLTAGFSCLLGVDAFVPQNEFGLTLIKHLLLDKERNEVASSLLHMLNLRIMSKNFTNLTVAPIV